MRRRRRSGWPVNLIPNMSKTSRSCQLALRCTPVAVSREVGQESIAQVRGLFEEAQDLDDLLLPDPSRRLPPERDDLLDRLSEFLFQRRNGLFDVGHSQAPVADSKWQMEIELLFAICHSRVKPTP